jgi:hypothetical protein
MLGRWHPSVTVGEVYDIMIEHEYGCDTFDAVLIERLTDYFTEKTHGEFRLCCSEWPNETGGVCAISFIEDGHPQLIMFDYIYPERIG